MLPPSTLIHTGEKKKVHLKTMPLVELQTQTTKGSSDSFENIQLFRG